MKKRRFIDESRRMQQSPRPMQLKLIRGFCVSLIVVATTWGAEPDSPGTRALTLEECIQTALQHNFDVQIIRYTPEISRYNLNISYAGYDPTFSFAGEHDYSLSPGGIDAQGRPFGGTSSETDRLSTGLRGLLPWGLTYDLGGSLGDRTGTQLGFVPDPNNPTTIVTNSFVDINTGNTISFRSMNFNSISARVPSQEVTSGNVGVLQLRQPVLKNFWIDSTRLNIVLNKRNLTISDLDLRFQVMSTVTAVEDAYYNLIFAEENVKVQTAARDLAKRLLEENKTKVRRSEEHTSELQSRSDLVCRL